MQSNCLSASLRGKSLTERFWAQVVKYPEGCWGWIGAVTGSGYGAIRGAQRKQLRSHRVSWEIHFEPIPDGLCVCHTCDNPICTNPKHLFLGSMGDNTRDCVAKGRRPNAGRHGHHRRGESHPEAVLTESDVRLIRMAYSFGNTSYGKLARYYKVTKENIAAIVKKRTWKHL